MADTVVIPGIGIVAVFGYLAIESWAQSRRREREAFYRSETLRRYSEGNQPEMLTRFLAEEKAARHELRLHQRERLRLAGLITMVAGIGFGAMMAGIAPGQRFYLFGLVPFLVGLTMLVYVYFLAPKLPADE